MNAGKLDRYITIQTTTESVSSTGERVDSWTTYHTCFASIVKGGGGQGTDELRRTSTNTKTFMIRYYGGIVPKMRILYNGAYYDITNIDEYGREGLIIQTERIS